MSIHLSDTASCAIGVGAIISLGMLIGYGIYEVINNLYPKKIPKVENSPERQAFLDDFDNKSGIINQEINEAYRLMHIEFEKKCDEIYENHGFTISNRNGNCYTVSKKAEK